MGSSFNIPIIYFSQVMGLAYGYSPKELAMDKLIVSADHLIRSRVPVEEFRKAQEAEAKTKKTKTEKSGNKEETTTEETE